MAQHIPEAPRGGHIMLRLVQILGLNTPYSKYAGYIDRPCLSVTIPSFLRQPVIKHHRNPLGPTRSGKTAVPEDRQAPAVPLIWMSVGFQFPVIA